MKASRSHLAAAAAALLPAAAPAASASVCAPTLHPASLDVIQPGGAARDIFVAPMKSPARATPRSWRVATSSSAGGSQPYLSELDPGGRLLFEARFVGADESYRAFRLPWRGRPSAPPAIAGRTAAADVAVYMSSVAPAAAARRPRGSGQRSAATP